MYKYLFQGTLQGILLFQELSSRMRKPSRILTISLLAMLLLACGPICFGLQATLAPPSQLGMPADLAAYAGARSVVDLTAEELLQKYPGELGGLELDTDHELLSQLLDKAGEKVAAFFRDFPKTTSKEQVRRERLGINERVEDSVTQVFYYAVYPDKTGRLEEARTDSKGRPISADKMRGSSFLTSGFASVSSFFHRAHQPGCRYRYLGKQSSEPYAHVIAFAQRPEIADFYMEFSTERMLTPAWILCQGLAWVDPQTYQILRMRTDLLAPRPDVMLDRQTTEVWFSEVHFGATPQTFWMPREVVVTILWSGQMYRNRHRYSDYQVFMVETQEKIELPKIKKEPKGHAG